MTLPTIISAGTTINAAAGQARDWFLSLQDHPERYRFATHEGIEFVHGSFGQVGAHFKTRERFYCLKLELLFELCEVGTDLFCFRLIDPAWLHVWGAFRVQSVEAESIFLRLEIGSSSRWGQFWLGLYPVAAAIRRQIMQEVAHIKASVEGVG